MNQTTLSLFGEIQQQEIKEESTIYTTKIKTPVYTPKKKQTHILELVDNSKSKKMIKEIENSNLSREEKDFLILAAQRHNTFNYEKIADYYASASAEMQDLMEKSALVIIDFDKAYKLGYIKLAENIAKQYLQQCEEGGYNE